MSKLAGLLPWVVGYLAVHLLLVTVIVKMIDREVTRLIQRVGELDERLKLETRR